MRSLLGDGFLGADGESVESQFYRNAFAGPMATRDPPRKALTSLKALGSGPKSRPSRGLETFENPNPDRDYTIHLEIPEFTCLCPKTGQPDFATLFVDYVPDRLCVELKSLKLYIWSFRSEGKFHEAVTNEILDDLVAATRPRYMRLRSRFLVRGGIHTSVIAEHRARGWTGSPAGAPAGPE